MSWREHKHEDIYSDADVDKRLKEELPHWYLENGLDTAQI